MGKKKPHSKSEFRRLEAHKGAAPAPVPDRNATLAHGQIIDPRCTRCRQSVVRLRMFSPTNHLFYCDNTGCPSFGLLTIAAYPAADLPVPKPTAMPQTGKA